MFNDKWLLSALSHLLGNFVQVVTIKPVSGGSINRAFCVGTTQGDYFVKVNSGDRFPNMFETEAQGLELLASVPAGLKTPGVMGTYNESGISCIVMENLVSGRETKNYWVSLGRGLASLHKNTADYFGLEYNNYIGSLPQVNTQYTSWTKFYINCRLTPQFEMAANQLAGTEAPFENLCSKLPEILPDEPPALLHGDLWSGNCMAAAPDIPCIFDPAVYYGHREVDIAMSLLFGGFDGGFYSSYNEAYPLLPGWQQRAEIYQLYYLLVHVNLFGGGYVGQVREMLRRFNEP